VCLFDVSKGFKHHMHDFIFIFVLFSVLSQKNRAMQGRHHILDMYGRFNVQGHFGVENNYLQPSSPLLKQPSYNEIKAHDTSRYSI